MPLETWIAYIVTVFIFLVSPGPSHLFMLSKSLSHGFDKSWATGVGDLTAHLWQIGIVSIGLVSFIYTFQNFFILIKWAGVLFLIYPQRAADHPAQTRARIRHCQKERRNINCCKKRVDKNFCHHLFHHRHRRINFSEHDLRSAENIRRTPG